MNKHILHKGHYLRKGFQAVSFIEDMITTVYELGDEFGERKLEEKELV